MSEPIRGTHQVEAIRHLDLELAPWLEPHRERIEEAVPGILTGEELWPPT